MANNSTEIDPLTAVANLIGGGAQGFSYNPWTGQRQLSVSTALGGIGQSMLGMQEKKLMMEQQKLQNEALKIQNEQMKQSFAVKMEEINRQKDAQVQQEINAAAKTGRAQFIPTQSGTRYVPDPNNPGKLKLSEQERLRQWNIEHQGEALPQTSMTKTDKKTLPTMTGTLAAGMGPMGVMGLTQPVKTQTTTEQVAVYQHPITKQPYFEAYEDRDYLQKIGDALIQNNASPEVMSAWRKRMTEIVPQQLQAQQMMNENLKLAVAQGFMDPQSATKINEKFGNQLSRMSPSLTVSLGQFVNAATTGNWQQAKDSFFQFASDFMEKNVSEKFMIPQLAFTGRASRFGADQEASTYATPTGTTLIKPESRIGLKKGKK